MHEPLKKLPKLSVKMQLLKDNIHALTLERKSLMEQVYESSKFASVVAAGINRVFRVFASFLSSFSAVPLIGSIFQGLVAIPDGIVYFSDPKKTFKEKMIAVVAIVVIAGIALTAIILGTIPTLILSLVASATFTLMEGFNVFSRIFQKFQSTKSYTEKSEFVNLVKNRNIPENDKFNEQLEIRAIELEHEIERPGVRSSTRREMKEELDFITGELDKRNINIGNDKENKAFQLSQLYLVHKEQIKALADVMSLITSETELEGNQEVLDEIQKIQNEILATEEDIISITKPIGLLRFEHDLAPPKLGLSLTNLAISTTGTVIAVFALLLGAGVLVAPPLLLPISVGVGIALAIVGLGKWIGEKMTEKEEREYRTQNEVNKKDIILNEALIAYEQKNNLTDSASLGNSSHTRHMSELLDKTKSVKLEPPAHADSAPMPHQEEFTLFTRKKEPNEVELKVLDNQVANSNKL